VTTRTLFGVNKSKGPRCESLAAASLRWGYILYESGSTLIGHEPPERSIPGIIVADAAVIVMPLLARAKRRVAAGMGSGAIPADSKQADFCTYLSAILLSGLLLNTVFGWWWADPVAGLVNGSDHCQRRHRRNQGQGVLQRLRGCVPLTDKQLWPCRYAPSACPGTRHGPSRRHCGAQAAVQVHGWCFPHLMPAPNSGACRLLSVAATAGARMGEAIGDEAMSKAMAFIRRVGSTPNSTRPSDARQLGYVVSGPWVSREIAKRRKTRCFPRSWTPGQDSQNGRTLSEVPPPAGKIAAETRRSVPAWTSCGGLRCLSIWLRAEIVGRVCLYRTEADFRFTTEHL
jgi:hypothetical protein